MGGGEEARVADLQYRECEKSAPTPRCQDQERLRIHKKKISKVLDYTLKKKKTGISHIRNRSGKIYKRSNCLVGQPREGPRWKA